MPSNKRAWFLAALAVGGFFIPSGTRAQQRNFRGTVVDSASGAPIAGAEVRVRGTKAFAISDIDGRFSVRLVESDAIVDVTMLGYETKLIPLWVPRDTILVIRMSPNPILLEALEVVSNQLVERRKDYFGRVRALDQDVLIRFRYNNMNEVVDRALMAVRPCAPGERERFCVGFGSTAVRPLVYVDDMRRAGGLEALLDWSAYEVYSIELYGTGRGDAPQIRVYTKSFMEKVARSGRRLMPVMYNVP